MSPESWLILTTISLASICASWPRWLVLPTGILEQNILGDILVAVDAVNDANQIDACVTPPGGVSVPKALGETTESQKTAPL